MDNIKVYIMNDSDFIASKWDKEKTIKHYANEFNLLEFKIECKEVNLDETRIKVECTGEEEFKTVSLREQLKNTGTDWEKPFLIASKDF